MCEPATPLTVLKSIRFSVSALAESAGPAGSYQREAARVGSLGIRSELDWCIAQLEAAGEGSRNMAVHAYEWQKPKQEPRP